LFRVSARDAAASAGPNEDTKKGGDRSKKGPSSSKSEKLSGIKKLGRGSPIWRKEAKRKKRGEQSWGHESHRKQKKIPASETRFKPWEDLPEKSHSKLEPGKKKSAYEGEDNERSRLRVMAGGPQKIGRGLMTQN